MTFDPKSVEVTCVTLPEDHWVQVSRKYIKVCGIVTLFSKNLNQRSLTLDDLWPHVCWGHMCDSTQGSLCPSPMKIHQSMWIQWPFFQTRTKGHWPLDDLWTHACWGHMCDSTQGSLCPSLMGIHQCMWIEWSILQNDHILHTTYYIHIPRTYYIQNEWSHSLLLNSVQARQKGPFKKQMV